MKKANRLRIAFILFTVLALQTIGFAQVDQAGMFLAGGQHDAEILLQSYITPAVNAFGAALGSGWYNTAKPHKLGGFDITFTSNIAIIPSKYEKFVIDDNQLEVLGLASPTDNVTPTIAGDNTEGPQMIYKDIAGFSGNAFRMPKGLNTNYVPTPMVQAGIGLIKGTEVMVRYMPDINSRGNEIGFWGIGGKHDLKQWIPGLKKLPALELSVMYGYTKLHAAVNMEITPEDIGAGGLPGSTSSAWDNQNMTLITQSQTANLIVSGNFPVICVYGAIGFVSSKTNLKLNGDYPSVNADETGPYVDVLSNPIDMEIKNQDGSVTKPRLNAGVRFKMAIVTIHFDYSWANYSVFTAGLGFSFR
jgi:hypothetical protein